jgi:Tfp pilus assembly protein PilF
MPARFTAALVVALTATAFQAHEHGPPELGSVSFETSCTPAAQQHFNRGDAWLHSFEYEEAEKSFDAAAAADPRCAMSHWGAAMTLYHPLWTVPTPAELAAGRARLQRAKTAGDPTPRERDYIAALDTFYGGPDRDYGTRALDYLGAMATLHRKYPADQEAAIFYALALITAGTMDNDPDYAREKEAARILNAALAAAPDHPGIAHYLIHGYDYPELAHLALAAARRYAAIAPASAHAQHMPSHIFTRLGLWDESVRSNLAAEAAAKAYAARHAMPGAWDEQLHAMDYLAYGYLQQGKFAEAQGVLGELNAIRRVDPANFKVAYAFAAIPARLALERRQWDEAARLTLSANAKRAVPWAKFREAEAHIAFARAVGAARGGNAAQARAEIRRLAELRAALPAQPGAYDWGKQVEIEQGIAEAWLAAAEHRPEAAALMRSAADLDDAAEKHPVTPGSILPAREQLGELLLELGRPQEALTAFETSLQRAPNRLAGLRGEARAAELIGDSRAETGYEARLQAVCSTCR